MNCKITQIRKLSKKYVLLLSLVSITSLAYSQNCYDTYSPSQFINFSSTVNQGYMGEYQIFMPQSASYDLSYKIETVSFPFMPKCTLNIGTPQEVIICDNSNYTQRPLILADMNSYDPISKSWTEQNYEIFRVYKSQLTTNNGSLESDPSTLITDNFRHGYTAYGASTGQPIFPHTILKHTIYYSDATSGELVDSSIFIFDHTRGMMRTYPFTPYNDIIGGTTHTHDITMTIDNNYCPVTTPYNNSLRAILGNAFGTSLVGYDSQNNVYEPNAPVHHYTIDKPITLTTINPSERIIYNPSDFDIDLGNNSPPLVFPTGYTFKTVYGLYPSTDDVDLSDVNSLYVKPEDVPIQYLEDPITAAPLITDGVLKLSTCTIKSGKLIIEPCVSLHDLNIYVDADGEVVYNSNDIYMVNSSIQAINGGTIIDNYVFSGTYNCFQECYDASNYDYLNDHTITANTTWNQDKNIARVITVETGNTLTIDGATIQFGVNGKIVVEEGAHLVLDDCTLRNYCNYMWEGIEVWGNPNISQTSGASMPSTQTTVSMNNAVIEGAKVGIYTGKRDVDNILVVGFEGARIRANNSVFKNNKIAVEFLAYRNFNPYFTSITRNNESYFKSCVFETTKDIKDLQERPEAFVKMEGVDGIRFLACDFKNIDPSDFALHHRGTGIYGLDAGFKVGGCMTQQQAGTPCGNIGSNTFSGLAEGIWASSTNGAEFINIQQNDFVNNRHAVVLEGTHNARVNRNNFDIPAPTDIGYFYSPVGWSQYITMEKNDYDVPVGVYLRESTYFSVDENNFNGSGINNITSLHDHGAVGLIVNNSAAYEDQNNYTFGWGLAYNNTFTNLDIGLQAENDNRGYNNIQFSLDKYNEGLKFDCNNFNILDYSVYITGTSGNWGFLRDQGQCMPNAILEKPAANIFSTTNSNHHIYSNHTSNSYQFEYNTYDDRSPVNNIVLAIVDPCGTDAPANICPSTFTIPKTKADLFLILNQQNSSITTMLNNYNALVDDGRTEDILLEIALASDQELKDTLTAFAPYLSDRTLISMLEKFPHFDALKMASVLIANSPLSERVMEAVMEHVYCCDPVILNSIILSQNGVSSRKELEWLIDESLFNRNTVRNELIALYMDSLALDSVIWLLEQDSSLQSKRQILPFYIKNNNFIKAQTCINQLAAVQEGNLDANLQLKQWQLNLAVSGENTSNLDSLKQEQLAAIVNTSLDLNMQAKVWHKQLSGQGYIRSPYPLDAGTATRKAAPTTLATASSPSLFKLQPNPSTVYTNITWEQEAAGLVNIRIYDVVGKEVFAQEEEVSEGMQVLILDLRDLKAGIYFVHWAANKQTETQQFIKTK